MSMIEVINALVKKGHKVSYYKRKDGGYLITSLDGVTYAGAKGNAAARELTGSKLSEKRKAQLEKIKPLKKNPLDAEIKKQLIRTQRKWRTKVNRKKEGRISTKKVRWNIENLGIEEASRKLSEAEKYAEGYAYSKNVNLLLTYIDTFINMYEAFNDDESASKMQDLYDYVESHKDRILDEVIEEIYQELYKLNNAPDDVDSLINNVKILVDKKK